LSLERGGAGVSLVFHGWGIDHCPGNCPEAEKEAMLKPGKWLPGAGSDSTVEPAYFNYQAGDFGRQGPRSQLGGREGSWQKVSVGFCETSGPAGSWVWNWPPGSYRTGLVESRGLAGATEAGVCVPGQGEGTVRTRETEGMDPLVLSEEHRHLGPGEREGHGLLRLEGKGGWRPESPRRKEISLPLVKN
jgi:hypothetical protein